MKLTMKLNKNTDNKCNKSMLMRTLFAIVSFLLLSQQVLGQSFAVVTPSNHTVYFQLCNGGSEAEATFSSYSMPNYGTSLSGTLIIPDSVEYNNVRYPVTAIGYNAFHHAYGMDTVILPNTITEIMQEAFAGCSNLASVAIPNSVTTIGNVAFGACHYLSDLTIGESVVTIGNQAFDCDTALVSLVIPNSVVSIGSAAFSQNYSLRTVRFGSSVASVGAACFSICPSLDSLIFTSELSPSFAGGFYGTPDTLNIIIPCGSHHSYSYWLGTQHNYTVPTVGLTMSVTSPQPQRGNAVIVKDADSNDVRCDSSVVVRAIPNYGYHFQQWSNGSTLLQDTLFIASDSSVSAIFAKNQYSLTVNSFNTSLGSVTGTGVYEYLDTVTVTATATAPHYFFERWSDGNTESSRSVVITGNMALTAYFAIDTHTVTVLADSIAHGSVSGGGRYTYGTVATLTAAPYSGYRFSHWSNGATFNPYVFAVLGDTVLTALFIADGEPYQDTVILNDTIYVQVHDTTTVTLTDTITNVIYIHDTTTVTLTDTITNVIYIHDTTTVTLTDTVYEVIYLHDTIYIHDTIVVGIDEVKTLNAKIYTDNGQIVVDGSDGNPVRLYDLNGRLLATKQDDRLTLRFSIPSSGTYLVKVGNYHTRKVVVVLP